MLKSLYNTEEKGVICYMNILVIGNGFDLAHDLPTTYQDFLKFTDDYKPCLENQYYEQMLEVKKLIDDNTWLRHFKRFYKCNGWIGFEKEISNIIQIIDKKIPQFEALKENDGGYVKFNVAEQNALKDFDLNVTQGIIEYKDFISKSKNRMLNDLNRLIRCFEIYLTCYINQISVNKISPNIKELHIDKVLSFNYTDTYRRIYDDSQKGNIEYDYIHGEADVGHDIETNNMVLGIDEFLPKDRKNKDVEFIAFKKYYQRIYKGTGSKYKDWINTIKKENDIYMERKHDCEIFLKNGYGLSNEIEERKAELKQLNENPPRHNLYIFGHSLDITDKDVLRDLILNHNVYTTIYYPDKEELGRKIANLVKVIGQKELIRRTGGSTKSIVFEPQQKMEPRKSQQSEENNA